MIDSESVSYCICAVLGLSFWLIEYIGLLIGTLATVEGSSRINPTAPQQERRITNSTWEALKHLHTHAGRWFWLWSGLIFFSYRITAETMVPRLLSILGDSPLGTNLGYMLAGVIFTNWQMAWVQLVISRPSSPAFFFKRLLQRPCCSESLFVLFLERIASATIFNTALDLQANFVPDSLQHGYRGLSIHLLPRILELVVSVPIRIIFVRMAASRLAGDDQPIIPLDHSLRGNSPLGAVDAWNTFDNTGRARVWKIYARLFATSLAIGLLGQMFSLDFQEYVSYPLVWFRP